MVYTDTHRLFVQSAISRCFFSEVEGIEIYRKVCEITKDNRQESFQNFITTVNQKLNTIDLEFRKSSDEEDGHIVWALVNTKGDEVAKLATEYTASEISYLKHLIELIVTADDETYSVSSIIALKESSKLKTQMTKVATEALLQKFVNDKWLIQSREGKYSLSQRTILELQSYLKEEFDENIFECVVCLEIVTKGQRCELQDCKARLHNHCADRYFSQNEKICPICKINWSESNRFGL
ncbi:11488_t:CDS:2 [Entrophospora sp. SA101]|nr:14213_t:CDS:2 [Entrophospora candida]CAH1760440.1 6339_t:CDS:2 [Entrophospora sp. SA101]CAG8483635.1 3339_t:CDS:2 [Entrophospora candida]CAJ0643643.1 11239_t:CDS:2 [Entrophospora sp. SA101]CAJ0764560.1 11484_t:CDS:2 [Entrophospora sp. SA101]